MTALLELTGVWKRFPGVVALKDVSLELRPGEVHALLGENGAGKSTLMGVAGGEIAPDEGTVSIAGEIVERLTPDLARQLGLAIVHQHPALLPDMTVAENLSLAVRKPGEAWMREALARAGSTARLSDRMEDVSVAQRALIELAKALALEPRILILDEPTAALGADKVRRVFEAVRDAAARNAAVVYISHRLPEVRQIADCVTVMRDGAIQATRALEEISDDEILHLIVGRAVEATFPPKAEAVDGSSTLTVRGLSGDNFSDVTLDVRAGEIVGLAGIAGNGQSDFMRALAGLERASGEAKLAGAALALGRPDAARHAGVAYLPADRHGEGLLMSLTVRENAALSALPAYSSHGVLDRSRERHAVEAQRTALNIRTASIENPVATLSGGNQQKVVLARALLSEPALVLAEEPTQGVDAGAHVEIYRILREIASAGTPVLVLSSDGVELEGLCDRVVVFSRGQVVGELSGDDVTEERIGREMVTATSLRADEAARAEETTADRVRRLAKGDYAPSVILAVVIVLLALYTWSDNARFLASFNITSLLTLLAALAFMAFGQLIVVMTAGIDLSVGPLAGLTVVVSSFFIVDGKSTAMMVAGFALMLGVCVVVGFTNGALVRYGRFTPVAATLASYIALQGVSLLLRPEQGGFITSGVVNAVQSTVGTIPVALIVAVVMAVALEVGLRRARWGLSLRAAGSDEQAAHRLGVKNHRTFIAAYIACSSLTFLGAIMLMAQLGVGDPTQGVSYTLSSITAVVLGGASLFGGRGSFIGALLGAALITEITNATTFLQLSQAWQFWFLGLLTLAAAAIYTTARRAGGTAVA
ncbi:ATP-binding cassette domain-containing protein [Solirubrobacter soli]|uniref:ATP-binding cassette domain-containing protein n=1 Tax=Solirubrobacter soli TaxID=363832 RepID=UPI000418A927|nr:ATP-binding cassette domain-containing protein [Solirubrobacter soli]